MKKRNQILYFPMALIMLLMLSLPSCNFIYDNYPEEEAEKAYILLSIDGVKGTTRAGDLFANDSIITKLRVIVYNGIIQEKNVLFTSGQADFDNPFRIELSTGTKNVYVIANEGVGALSTSLASTSLTEAGLLALMADDSGAALSSPFVMTGKILNTPLVQGLQQRPVTLTRVAAKINLKFKKDTDNSVEITKVSLVNNAGKSTLWEGAALVGSQSYWSHAVANGMTLTSSFQDYLTVYVYENVGNSSSNKSGATRLEVEALYNGLPTTYRVYVNEDVSVANPTPGNPVESETTPKDHFYNIKRNYEYQITGTIKGMGEFNGLTIFTEVQPWTGVNKTYFVGYGYTVEVDGTRVTVSNHDEDCPPHTVKLVALQGLTFTEAPAGDTKIFDQVGANDTATFTLSAEPTSGNYLEVYYNGVLVNTFTN